MYNSDEVWAGSLAGVAPLFSMDFTITRDDDWHDLLPQFLIGGAPPDVTNWAIDLWVRPTFGHATTMLHLAKVSAPSDGIWVDVATEGLMTVHVAQATVESSLPAGHWQQFAVATDNARTYGWQRREIWRGSLLVLPGNND